MKNLKYRLTVLIAVLMSLSASADNGNRKLICSSTYGDQLGETSINVCTAKRYHFYDAHGNIQAVINSKTDVDESVFNTVDYNSYCYNSLGLLQSIDVFQYGAFDFLQRDMKPSPAASSSFEYDENGNLVKETTGNVITEYEYDAEGNIIKETVSTGKTVVYEDFTAGKNKYAKAISSHTSKNNESEFYDEFVTYDQNGNKISALRNYNIDNTYVIFGKEYGHHVGDFISYEEWIYDANGIISLYRKSVQQDEVSGEYLWTTKTEYERINGNVDCIRRVNYDARYVDGEAVWSRRGTPFVDEYCRFDNAETLNGLALSVAQSVDSYGVMELTISIPQAVVGSVSKVNIYRNGELVHEIAEVAESVTYLDSGVKAGSQEYFVTLSMPEADYSEFCCSNKVSVAMDIPLPKARIIGVLEKASGTNGTTIVTVGYEYDGDPGNAAFGYKETFLVTNGGGYPDDAAGAVTSDPDQRDLKRDFESDREVNVQVVTRYALGTIYSEPFVFTPSMVDLVDLGISELEQPCDKEQYYDLQGRRINNPVGVVLVKTNGGVRKIVR